MAVASPAAPRTWSDVGAVALVVLFVSVLYGARLADQPVVGEESRWATGAREMLATGDWIVPRQQGQVFPERPPMTMWLMAIAGYFRGDVDAIAIRLPSVVAIVLTTLLIYGYTRALVSGFAALVAALAYATMAQVLQIGRMGESEAVFTLLVSASLLMWHLGYARSWRPVATWSLGFAFAALGALVKGPQAPVYFVAITGAYLAVCRDWRYLVSWQYAAGGAVFVAIIAAWQIPFYWATDLHSVAATWAGLAADRVRLAGLVQHLAAYPLETFACLLPWSPILVALAKRETRQLLADQRPLVLFLLVALAVAYPTVWIVAGAQARYFMPLYPLIAVLVGLVIDRCSVAVAGRYPRRAWHQFLLCSSALVVVLSIVTLIPTKWALGSYQPLWFRLALVPMALAAVSTLWWCYRTSTPSTRLFAVTTIALVAGIAEGGALMNSHIARWNDPSAAVARVKSLIGSTTPLVSLTAIDHRFAYFYGDPIAELDWPREFGDVPPGVDYFCFMRNPGDTAERREAGRGRRWTKTPGTLPFAWEEVATLCVERRIRNQPQPVVVLGRVVKPRQAQITDATQPRPTAMNLSTVANNERFSR
jgi:4-amino-4-deoxy-L-arabinose transferase-like glycosyltransferase